MKMLFYPGGPGLNGYPESQLLTSKYAAKGVELLCWHEPSNLRPDGYPYREADTFQNYLDSAEAFFLEHYDGSPLYVFSFCFGNQALRYLLSRHEEEISKVLVVTPDYCIKETFKNMFSLAANDYRENGLENEATRLEEIIPQCEGTFTDLEEEAFGLYANNPRFMSFYWKDALAGDRYASCLATEEYSIDVKGFFDCCRSRFEVELTDCPVPAVVVYGAHDKIVSIPLELANIRKMFADCSIVEMNTGHYPQIEREDEFLNIIIEHFL